MSCDCENTNYSIPRVVRGNDFTLVVKVKNPVLKDSETVLEDFDVSESEDVKVNIVSTIGKKTAMSYTVEEGKLLIQFDETVKAGKYGLEITGKKDGTDWRFYAKPGEVIEIVEPTSGSYLPIGAYSLTAELGVVSLPNALIAEAVKKAQSATDSATEATEKANTAANNADSSSAKADEATKAANEATQNANSATEKAKEATTDAITAKENAESATKAATQAKEEADTATANADAATANAKNATVNASEATAAANEAATSANNAAQSANDAVESMEGTYLKQADAQTKYISAEAANDTTEYSEITI